MRRLVEFGGSKYLESDYLECFLEVGFEFCADKLPKTDNLSEVRATVYGYKSHANRREILRLTLERLANKFKCVEVLDGDKVVANFS